MAVSNQAIMQLREKTGAGVMDCKRALEQTAGDVDKAIVVLREQGIARAAKKSSREARMGLIEAYIHGGGRIGVLVEVNCETDFVGRNDAFRNLAREIAMQIAATNPSHLTAEDLAADPDSAGLNAQEVALLEQPYIRDPKLTIRDLITNAVATLGENIQVRRFQRFELGQ